MELLGCTTKKELNRLIRVHNIAVDKVRKRHHIAFDDVARVRQRAVLGSVNRREQHRGIVTAIDGLINARQVAMDILDGWLVECSLDYEKRSFRYGHPVDTNRPPGGLWYVYHLCYPNGRPFYIGKGIGPRMYQHEREAKQGIASHKCNVIRKLLHEGHKIHYRVVFVTPDEGEAYAFETLEIARVGYKNLTNMALGGVSSEERGRLLGLSIPRAQMNYQQLMRRSMTHGKLSQEERKRLLHWWAWERACLLRDIGRLAESICHERAIQQLDTEIESLKGYYARQLSLADLEIPQRRRWSEWKARTE